MSGPDPTSGPFYDARIIKVQGANPLYENLFMPSSTYLFSGAMSTPFPIERMPRTQRNVDDFNLAVRRYTAARDKLARGAFQTLNKSNFTEVRKRLVDDPDLAQFVYLIEDGTFAVEKDNARELSWFKNTYLQRVYANWVADHEKSKTISPAVLIRPITLRSKGQTCAYYICPVDVTIRQDAWEKCGFEVEPLGFYPLDISSPDDFLVRYQDMITGTFRLPKQLAEFDSSEFARFWAMQADAVNNLKKKIPIPAVPQQNFNFGDISGGAVNVVSAGDNASVSIVPPAPLPFPDPFAPENLRAKFIATGDPSYFGDKPVIEPKDKLIAALGTAAAAAITIGIAKAYS